MKWVRKQRRWRSAVLDLPRGRLRGGSVHRSCLPLANDCRERFCFSAKLWSRRRQADAQWVRRARRTAFHHGGLGGHGGPSEVDAVSEQRNITPGAGRDAQATLRPSLRVPRVLRGEELLKFRANHLKTKSQ